jgi:hypothetical protein
MIPTNTRGVHRDLFFVLTYMCVIARAPGRDLGISSVGAGSAGPLPIAFCQLPESAFFQDQVRDLLSQPGILGLKLFDACRLRKLPSRYPRLPVLLQRLHHAERAGHLDPGMALRHERFRLARHGEPEALQFVHFRSTAPPATSPASSSIGSRRVDEVPQSGPGRVIFPADELTKMRFAGECRQRWTMGVHDPLVSLDLSEVVMLFASFGLVAVLAFGFLI